MPPRLAAAAVPVAVVGAAVALAWSPAPSVSGPGSGAGVGCAAWSGGIRSKPTRSGAEAPALAATAGLGRGDERRSPGSCLIQQRRAAVVAGAELQRGYYYGSAPSGKEGAPAAPAPGWNGSPAEGSVWSPAGVSRARPLAPALATTSPPPE